mmetsp:Transcript_96733/g.250380  ORF Transcript_96733/g.250380 Transcript_96733/m.250380 type:complete len:271 (-) Transcript_96733:79-891(-)
MAAIDTLVFDVDDTLYPVSSGFSEHRNGDVICNFMLAKLGFESADEAMKVRHEYFQRYHSSMKGLKVASDEGKTYKPFLEKDLADWFADECAFAKFLKPNPELAEILGSLRDEAGLRLVVFSNAPRRYALNCLEALGVRKFFPDDQVFGVEDVLPACKPEEAAFQKVLKAVGSSPERAVMFEDSMKNIRACSAIGMHTVLIDELAGAQGGEAKLLDDIPCADDPAVGAVLQHIGQLRSRLPSLWQRLFEQPRVAQDAIPAKRFKAGDGAA